MSAAALLAQLEAAGVRITREGDTLRVRGMSGVDPAPYREQITAHKPALLALLRLQEEIVATATVATEAFDRQHYDTLWVQWHSLNAQENAVPCPRL
jgi:hypothetical protein